jgi:hypothetical protein
MDDIGCSRTSRTFFRCFVLYLSKVEVTIDPAGMT